MAEWRAELQNYHIKPGFPRTPEGTSAIATDSEKKGQVLWRSRCSSHLWQPLLALRLCFSFFLKPGYVRAAGPFHLAHYTCPHTSLDVNYACSSKANFPNVEACNLRGIVLTSVIHGNSAVGGCRSVRRAGLVPMWQQRLERESVTLLILVAACLVRPFYSEILIPLPKRAMWSFQRQFAGRSPLWRSFGED